MSNKSNYYTNCNKMFYDTIKFQRIDIPPYINTLSLFEPTSEHYDKRDFNYMYKQALTSCVRSQFSTIIRRIFKF